MKGSFSEKPTMQQPQPDYQSDYKNVCANQHLNIGSIYHNMTNIGAGSQLSQQGKMIMNQQQDQLVINIQQNNFAPLSQVLPLTLQQSKYKLDPQMAIANPSKAPSQLENLQLKNIHLAKPNIPSASRNLVAERKASKQQ